MSTGDTDADAVIQSFDAQTPAPSGDSDADAVIEHFNNAKTPNWTDTNIKRPLGLAGRAAIEGVAALPMLVMNAGVATRNVVGNAFNRLTGRPETPNYTMPSDMLGQSLDEHLPHPTGVRENVIGAVESGLAGAAIPAPTSGIKVPANFKTATETEKAIGLDAIKNGQAAGYVVPPATKNPTTSNRVLESISGKIATQQMASLKNQSVTNALAKDALGLNREAPLTPDVISQIKSQASNDYEAIRDAGTIKMSKSVKDGIQSTVKKFNSTADEIPSLADKDLQPIADELTSKDQFSANALLGAIRSLRTKADMAFREGNGGTGHAYKQMAGHLEDAIDTDLGSRGEEFKDLVDNFRDARRRIAVANTVGDALNQSTGNVIAPKLATALKKGAPLNGPLRTIAEFAQSAPFATKEPTSSPVSHLDMAVPAATALFGKSMSEKVSGFALPVARNAARKYLLSKAGQSAATPPVGGSVTGVPGIVRGAPATLQALSVAPEGQDNER